MKLYKIIGVTATLFLIGYGMVRFRKQFYNRYLKQRIYNKELINQIINGVNITQQEKLKSLIPINTSQVATIKSVQNSEYNMCVKLMIKLKLKNESPKNNNPFIPPFQDGIFINKLQKTHHLIYNKFPLYENHLLVITRTFEIQHLDVTKDDLENSYITSYAMKGFCFYNSGKESGASQRHKHLQVIPYQFQDLPFLNLILKTVRKINSINKYSNKNYIKIDFPIFNSYQYRLVKIKEFSIDQNLSAYGKYLKNVFDQIMKELNNPELSIPFNLMFGNDWILIILRKSENTFGNISMNALGCLGSVLTDNQDLFNMIKGMSSENILKSIILENDNLQFYQFDNFL